MFPQCTCLFRPYGIGVPATPIHLFNSYTTPLCKAPFRENIPKLVKLWCGTADAVWN